MPRTIWLSSYSDEFDQIAFEMDMNGEMNLRLYYASLAESLLMGPPVPSYGGWNEDEESTEMQLPLLSIFEIQSALFFVLKQSGSGMLLANAFSWERGRRRKRNNLREHQGRKVSKYCIDKEFTSSFFFSSRKVILTVN